MTFVLPYRLTPDQDQKNIVNGTQQNFEAVTTTLNTNSFKIVSIATMDSPQASVTDAGVGLYNSDIQSSAQAHNLGYIPAIIAFIVVGGGNILLPYSTFNQQSGVNNSAWWYWAIQVDSLNVTAITAVTALHMSKTIVTQQIKYYLLQETATG